MAEITLVVKKIGLRSRDGAELPIGSVIQAGAAEGWANVPAQIEQKVVELCVDGVPLDRAWAAAALRTRTAPAPRAVNPMDLPRARPKTKQEARSAAAIMAGPILDHGNDRPRDTFEDEHRANVRRRSAAASLGGPILDHGSDHPIPDPSLAKPVAGEKKAAETPTSGPASPNAASLAGPILDHAADSGTLESRAKGMSGTTPATKPAKKG